MMMPSHRVRILVATQPVDFRKGHDGLAALVQSALKEDPFTGTVFVFRAKRRNRQSFSIQRTGIADRVSMASAFWPGAARPRWWPAARGWLDPGRGPARFLPNLAGLDVRSRLLCAAGQRATTCRARGA